MDDNNNSGGSDDNKVAWNLSAHKINLIGELIWKGTNSYITGNLLGWFHYWQTIFDLVNNRVEEDEHERMLKLEKRIFKEGTKVNEKGRRVVIRNKFHPLCRIYMRKVNIILKDLGMDIKENEYDTRGL